MNNQIQLINQLTFENYIWIIFIIIGVFNIFGDELIKKSIITNNSKPAELAKTIFTIIIIITIIIYLYFIQRNYQDFLRNRNNQSYQIRLLGSILILVGTLCFLYFLLTAFNIDDSVSNI